MKKIVVLLSVISCFTISFAQENNNKIEKEIDGLKTQINSLRSSNSNLNDEINSLESQIEKLNVNLDSLNVQVRNNESSINTKSTKLNSRITTTETKTNEKLVKVDETIGKTTLYSIIGVLLAIILSGILYFLLIRRQKVDKTDMIEKLSKTKSSIEQVLVKEFEKQTELMETQIKLMESNSSKGGSSNDEIDHTLALRVADEITLIERNISLMDASVKGLKQLSRSVSKLRDNLLANGYEIPELLGKKYDQGMKVIVVSSIPDENIEKDYEIITKIIKPQVNFQDKMIQTAQIEVTVGC